MKVTLLLTVLLIIAYVNCNDEHTLDEKWQMFKQKYGKAYKHGNEERQEIFAANLKRIEEYNKKFEAGLVNIKAEVDISTDLTDDEVKPFGETRVW